jgi:hypothetical protein
MVDTTIEEDTTEDYRSGATGTGRRYESRLLPEDDTTKKMEGADHRSGSAIDENVGVRGIHSESNRESGTTGNTKYRSGSAIVATTQEAEA